MSNKLRVGIDLNEILRAKWLQFDRFYVQEFGEEGIPDEPYVYDFFKNYKWEDTTEIERELKEPEDFPEDINPLDYQVDKETGEANADFALFKAPKEKFLTAKEVYNRFMYEDFVFEIHGSAPYMYKGMDVHVKDFLLKYKDSVEFTVFSRENYFSIPSTLFFLGKITSRFSKYHFFENNGEVWDNVDVFITTDPEFLSLIPENKKVVKLIRPYNKEEHSDITPVMHLNDLNGNPEFEKLIEFKKAE